MTDRTTDIMEELGTVLFTIDSMDENLSSEVARFIDDELLDPDDLSTYSLALHYAKWAMTHPNLVLDDQLRFDCDCFRGSKWNLDMEGDIVKVVPCDRCSSSQYRFWKGGFVGDSDRQPE